MHNCALSKTYGQRGREVAAIAAFSAEHLAAGLK